VIELDFHSETRLKALFTGRAAVHPYLLYAVDLFHWLPAWGAGALAVSVVVGIWSLGSFLGQRFQRNIDSAIRHICEPLRDALVEVHSVEPAEKPADRFTEEAADGPDPELDLAFFDGVEWLQIEATIVPRDRNAQWEPRLLELVASDFDPSSDFEVCEEAGALCSVEICRNGEFEPLLERCVHGPQRLRMLFATPPYLRDAKFACQFTSFGKLEIPGAVALAS
jgi:hypothetical protein